MAWPTAQTAGSQPECQMNDIIWRAVKRAQIPAVKEPAGLLRSDGKRPDGVILIPWAKGKLILAESHLSSTCWAGSGSETGSRQQDCKVLGTWKDTYFPQLPSRQRDHGASKLKLVNWCKKSGDTPLSSQRTAYKPPFCFRDCQWLLVQRGNAVLFLGTFPQY